MEKEFVPYEIAGQLKELGFDEPCLKVGNPNGHIMWKRIEVDRYLPTVSINDIIQVHYSKVWIQIPTFSQAFEFFRENYQMVFCYEPILKKDLTYIFFIYMEVTGEKVFVIESKYNEEAELACLDKLIEITKNKQ